MEDDNNNDFSGFDEIDPDRNHFNNDNINCKTHSIDSFNCNLEIDY